MSKTMIMTWEEIDNDWNGLQKRHRMEIAERVARYCIGHKMEEVGKRLGYSKTWTITQLDYAGIGAALGVKGVQSVPLTGSTDNVAKEVPRLVQDYGPSIKADIGRGGNNVNITGNDAEEFKPYLEHYIDQGHEPAAATRLAKAEWAAESAVEAGIIKEAKNKRNEKVNQILFPGEPKNSFDLDFKMHMARVLGAAEFLDKARVSDLRRKSTCEMVSKANEAWSMQVELVLQHYQPSMES